MSTSWSKAMVLSLAVAIAAAAPAQRPGDLVITPTRVLLDDKTRSGDITLVNRGMQTVRYRLTLVDMEMSEDGMLRRVQGGDNSASGVLRLSPREIVLEPGLSQRIKVAAFFPSGMADRELRSHLAFEPISIPKAAGPENQLTPAFKLNLEMRSTVTIPVIARHGKLFAEASMSEAAVIQDQDGAAVKFKISRTGTRSVRGDLDVSFQPAKGGAQIALAKIEGLPVYFPNADRIVTVRLKQDVRSLGKGEILISFAEERSRGAVAARTVVPLTG